MPWADAGGRRGVTGLLSWPPSLPPSATMSPALVGPSNTGGPWGQLGGGNCTENKWHFASSNTVCS